jgi:hypothetical protein
MGLRLLLACFLLFPTSVWSWEEKGVVSSSYSPAASPPFAPLALRYRQETQQRVLLSCEAPAPRAIVLPEPASSPARQTSVTVSSTLTDSNEWRLRLCSLLL